MNGRRPPPQPVAVDLTAFKIDDVTQLRKGEYLDQGAQGAVFKVHYRDQIVAVKELFDAYDEEIVRLMLQLEHEHLINILAFSERPFCLVMPLCRGSLRAVIEDTVDLSPVDFYRYTCQIALGMQYLHASGVVHRDLKPANVLLTNDCNVKISDFDMSKQTDYTWMSMRTFCGSPLWMAPEIWVKRTYTKSVDVWSYAVVIWELITQTVPYDNLLNQKMDRTQLLHGLHESRIHLPFPPGCTHRLRQLLTACTRVEPTDRPSFNHIVDVLQQVTVNETVWNKLKPEWRTIKFNYAFDEKAASLIQKGLTRWNNFTDHLRNSLQHFLTVTANASGADFKTVDGLLSEWFTSEEQNVIDYIIRHEIKQSDGQLSLAQLYRTCKDRLEMMTATKNDLFLAKNLNDDYAKLIWLNVKTEDEALRLEGVKRLLYFAHCDRFDSLQRSALPLIVSNLKSKNVELLRASWEVLAVERMRKKLNFSNADVTLKTLNTAFQRTVGDRTIAKCFLLILADQRQLQEVGLIDSLMRLLKSCSQKLSENMWTVRRCWEILHVLVEDPECSKQFFRLDGLKYMISFAKTNPNDCFLQRSIFKLFSKSPDWRPLLNAEFVTLLCDYIDETQNYAFFSYDPVVVMVLLLRVDPSEWKSLNINRELCTATVSNAIFSWEFGEMNHAYQLPKHIVKTGLTENNLTQLLYVTVCADKALTRNRASFTNDDVKLLQQLCRNGEQLDPRMKMLAEIARNAAVKQGLVIRV